MNPKLNLKLPKPEYLQRWFDKYKYPLLVCLVGLVLMLWPKNEDATAERKSPEPVSQSTEQTAQLERQMEALFSQMSGVGRVKVLLTLKSSKETVYAYDTDSSLSKQENSMSQSSKAELITVGNGSGETPVVTQTHMPEYLGAVVVCEGADNAKVCLLLTEAVRSLTGITSDNIVILKMQK